jgi:hypothetical protein
VGFIGFEVKNSSTAPPYEKAATDGHSDGFSEIAV